MRAIAKSLGSHTRIGLDANMGYTLKQAREFLRSIRDIPLANFEEPVESLSDMAELRKEFGIPVSTHCFQLDALLSYPEIDSVVSDIHLHGGVSGTLAFIQEVVSLRRRFWLRSMWELGISWAAMCHLGMICPELDRPSQSLINWVSDDLILGDPWLIQEGGVRPPHKPGLGVELDREALSRHMVP